MTDGSDDERAPREGATSEGVRILGAEEARRALDAQRGVSADDGAADDGDAPEPIEATMELELDLSKEGEERPMRRVHYTDEGPTWSASTVSPASEEPSGEVPPLPHWTEPPTGAVPSIFADDEGDDDLDAWAPITGGQPRFRAEGSDWTEADFAAEDLSDDQLNVGALKEPTIVDEDEEFAKEIDARRRRTPRGRAPRTMVTNPPPAATTPASAAPRPPRPGRPDTEAERVPSGRDLPTALVTAGIVGIVALVCFNMGTWWTAVLAAVIVGLGSLEFTAALQARGFRPAALLALLASGTLPLATREFGTNAYPVFFALVVMITMLWFLWEVTPGRPLLGVATTVLAFAYVGGLGGFAGLILQADDGIGIILGLALCVITYDVFGFFVGSQFGKSPIAPKTSPNKSFEGTLAGMLGAVLMGWLFVGGQLGPGIFPWSPGRGAVLGLFIAVGAFLGDLCESMLKRDLGVKDFGSILPGHGGVLDRFDAILFCLPITYFLALHFNILNIS
jgi:phosphatidate cytidylyltransferase